VETEINSLGESLFALGTWAILPVHMTAFRLSDFDYLLPPELIAQTPAPERGGSRLLSVSRTVGTFGDLVFKNLPDLLKHGDLLVFNDSKVIPARLYAAKETGGRVEVLVERLVDRTTALALLRSGRKPKQGASLFLRGDSSCAHSIRVLGRDSNHDDRFLLDFQAPVLEVLQAHGELPLPPYIDHTPNADDTARYQTIYAAHPGSVAAPTAGLHFDEPMLEKLKTKGVGLAHVTLHVGSGTFAPVREEDISKHRMHSEWCELSRQTAEAIARTKTQGGRVIAVGTTSLRTLESAAQRALDRIHSAVESAGEANAPTWLTAQRMAGQWETDIFITPGYEFKLVDALITNFHLPKSTLLMLVSAFAGFDSIRSAYAHAIAERYRFFSYGDAMFLERC